MDAGAWMLDAQLSQYRNNIQGQIFLLLFTVSRRHKNIFILLKFF